MPDRLLEFSLERTYLATAATQGVLTLAAVTETTITLDASLYGPRGPINQPLQRSAVTIVSTLVPVIVHRANDDKPWKILPDPAPEAPLPSLHAALLRKFGCNLLRWTEGEAGRPLPLQGWVAGESAEPGTGDEKADARCMKPETGAACGEGEKGCLDQKGNACTGMPGEQHPETGPHKGGLGKRP